ncbi:hypothetical protein HGK72_30830 [Mycolicibacterium fortuitum]|uniref:hypothetical protein n=1 Tax=Mycolicibacterium fortuitum TaxID=1766 RepID=UPI00148F9905|nr:hypothetical protein [Mycolicibacterium fortuitum]
MSNDEDLHARLADHLDRMFYPHKYQDEGTSDIPEDLADEPVIESDSIAESEPELPGKGNVIPGAGNIPDPKAAQEYAESLKNPYHKVVEMVEQQNREEAAKQWQKQQHEYYYGKQN